jgi:lysophospholipase L1-like esterase
LADIRRRRRRSEDPVHPNAEGHRLIAEGLERSLTRARSGGSHSRP